MTFDFDNIRVQIEPIPGSLQQADIDRLLPLVSDQRREQALRFHHLHGQYCCLRSYVMLAEMLGFRPHFTYNDHGKPYINQPLADHQSGPAGQSIAPKANINHPSGFAGPFFSISHCQTAIMVAVSDREVGVDIESPRRVSESLIRHTMNDAETRDILAAADPSLRFLHYWTRKEALLKLTGTGISDDMREVLVNGETMSVRTEHAPDNTTIQPLVFSVAAY